MDNSVASGQVQFNKVVTNNQVNSSNQLIGKLITSSMSFWSPGCNNTTAESVRLEDLKKSKKCPN